jgi:serine carboxypeptidase-like clade 1
VQFFIAGESYAGIYVPTLAQKILEGNQNGGLKIRLEGIMVGNGCTDPVYDGARIPCSHLVRKMIVDPVTKMLDQETR